MSRFKNFSIKVRKGREEYNIKIQIALKGTVKTTKCKDDTFIEMKSHENKFVHYLNSFICRKCGTNEKHWVWLIPVLVLGIGTKGNKNSVNESLLHL